jgi:hypothetical protein
VNGSKTVFTLRRGGFVDQSAEQITAFDAAGVRSRDRCCRCGRVQRERAVGRSLL